MTVLKNLPVHDFNMLLHVVQQSFSVHQHYQLFGWLQEEAQQFGPHDIVIAAWGDVRSGEVSFDIKSATARHPPLLKPNLLKATALPRARASVES